RNEVGKQSFDNEKTMVTSFPQQTNPSSQLSATKTEFNDSQEQIPITITQTETFTETDTSSDFNDDKTEVSSENINLAETLSQSIATAPTAIESTKPKPQPLNYDALSNLNEQAIHVDTTTPTPSYTTDRVKNRTYNSRPKRKRT